MTRDALIEAILEAVSKRTRTELRGAWALSPASHDFAHNPNPFNVKAYKLWKETHPHKQVIQNVEKSAEARVFSKTTRRHLRRKG